MAQPRRRKSAGQAPEVVIAEVILKGIWYLIKLPFRLLFQRNGGGSSAKAGTVPPMVAAQLAQHWPQDVSPHAVAEADKLLDAALQAAGVPGMTLGERLKAGESRFSSSVYQQVWRAHKLRNTLAHEVGAQAHPAEVESALQTFRVALRELGIPL